MEYTKLGDSDLHVSRIAFGCEQLGGVDWGIFDQSVVKNAVRRSLDLGVNFFDTADVYALGGSEETLAEALGESRRDVIIATKVGINWNAEAGTKRANTFIDLRPERVMTAIEDSLRRLRVEAIGLFYLHWPDLITPIEETLGALSKAQLEGKIRYVGVSNFSAKQIRNANAIHRICAVQIHYNLLNRAAEIEVLPCCKELGIGTVVYGPLAQGLLTGKYGKGDRFDSNDRRSRLAHFQDGAIEQHLKVIDRLQEVSRSQDGKSLAQIALRWLLDKEDVSSIITGVKTPGQIEDNVGVIGWHLSDKDIAYLES